MNSLVNAKDQGTVETVGSCSEEGEDCTIVRKSYDFLFYGVIYIHYLGKGKPNRTAGTYNGNFLCDSMLNCRNTPIWQGKNCSFTMLTSS